MSMSRVFALSVAVALLCPLLAGCGGGSDGTVQRLHELVSGFPGYDGYEDNNRPRQP
jgi:hypothetical protein